MERLQQYKTLVVKRKQCKECMQEGDSPNVRLVNPAQYPLFDTAEIGHWSKWQNSLSARIVLVGQDWGGTDYFFKYQGKDFDENPTNVNLMKLFEVLGFDIGTATSPIKHADLFFTNSILCIKHGTMAAKTMQQWYSNCGSLFLKPLVDIIKPKAIIALGEKAYESVHKLFLPEKTITPLKSAVGRQITLTDSLSLFPVYHCGTRGININRRFPLQQQDWTRIGQALDEG